MADAAALSETAAARVAADAAAAVAAAAAEPSRRGGGRGGAPVASVGGRRGGVVGAAGAAAGAAGAAATAASSGAAAGRRRTAAAATAAAATSSRGGGSGRLADAMESGWNRRGGYSALWRSVEIWWFFLRLGIGELRLRRVTDEAAKGVRRRLLAARLKRGLLALGPTFIKLGQLLSTRIDVLPREYIEELVDLQDRVPGFSAADAIATVERELGRPLALLYDTFEEEPLAAASLGQVHRATLDGEVLAVKVQRAGLRELFDVDLKNLRALAVLLDRVDPKTDGAQRNWLGIFEESAVLLYEEIDYTHEAANAERMRENFAGTPWVRIPAVVWERTSEAVLTMEFVQGVKINDYAAMEAMGVDRALVARRAAQSFLTQLLRHGFFHDVRFGGGRGSGWGGPERDRRGGALQWCRGCHALARWERRMASYQRCARCLLGSACLF